MSGFIKVYREQLHSDLFRNSAVLNVWIFLCEQARFKPRVQDGIEIQPGQLLISASQIGRHCRLKEGRVRYILGNLEKNGFICRQNIRNRYSLITVLDPTERQKTENDVAMQPDVAVLNCQTQAVVSVVASAKQADEAFEPEKGTKTACGTFYNVYLSAEEKHILRERSACFESYIENLSAYKKRTKKDYADDFTVLCEWISKDDISEKRAAARQAAQQLKKEKEKPAFSGNASHLRLKTDYPDTPASYDLEKAERQARESVPKMRKRPKKQVAPFDE